MTPGGDGELLRDAIAEAIRIRDGYGGVPRERMEDTAELRSAMRQCKKVADVAIAALRTVLREHPEAVMKELGIEQVGTWLLPEAYGNDYDHFTQTKCATQPGVCVAVYAPREVQE